MFIYIYIHIYIFWSDLGVSGNGLSPVQCQAITWTNDDSVFALEFWHCWKKWVLGHRFVYLVIGHWHKISIPKPKILWFTCKFCVNVSTVIYCQWIPGNKYHWNLVFKFPTFLSRMHLKTLSANCMKFICMSNCQYTSKFLEIPKIFQNGITKSGCPVCFFLQPVPWYAIGR